MQILEHILKIRREKKQNMNFRKQLAISWQPFGIAKCGFPTSHCEFRIAKFSNHKTLFICLTQKCKTFAKIRIAKFAAKFATSFALRNSLWFFALRNFALRNSLWFFALPNSQCGFSHCEIRCGFSHCEIRCGFSHCEIRNTLRTVCELIAKIPTVLPSDFVLRITFSSELRFRRFWYRWKA